MFEKLKRAVWWSAIFTFVRLIYSLVDAIGNLQTAKELIPRLPGIVQLIVRILYWPLTGPLVCVACLIVLVALNRRRTSNRETAIHPATVGDNRGSQPIVSPLADSPLEARVPPESSERQIVDVTPDYLRSFFVEHISIQAQRLIEPYIGKWMRVSGPLDDVSNNEYFSQVVFERRPGTHTVTYMYFRQPDRRDRLSVLRRGTELTVLGQIERVNAMEVHLNNCELIHPS